MSLVEVRGHAAGQADLSWRKSEQKLFVSYRKSPSLTGVKVRKSISFGPQFAEPGESGGGDLCLETAPLKFLALVLMIPQNSEVREQDTKIMGTQPY